MNRKIRFGKLLAIGLMLTVMFVSFVFQHVSAEVAQPAPLRSGGPDMPGQAVSSGYQHTCAIQGDGTMLCWGNNDDGQSTVPTGSFTQVNAGIVHTCGLKLDGILLCWGSNDFGQTTVPAGTYIQVSNGGHHTCGLESGGSLSCWGVNDYGQTTVPAGTYSQVSAGYKHTCGLKVDGTLICWGRDDFGQSTVPPGTYTQVSAGGYHTCGLQNDGTLVCWGDDENLQIFVPPAGAYTQVSAGFIHTCGLLGDGTLLCWGADKLDNGQTTVPAGIYTQVSAGVYHTCGLKNDGTLLCWGHNDDGQTTVPSPYTFGIDTTPPSVVTSLRAAGDPTAEASVDFTLTFSEYVIGVDTTDFYLTNTGGISGAAVTGVTGSGVSYTVSINTGTGNGTIRLDVLADDSIRDAVNLPLDGEYTSGQIYTVDKTVIFFEDDFETDNFSLWTRFNDGGGFLYTCEQAAIHGIYGACVERGTNDKRKQLIDDTPENELTFNARFNFDINSLSMNNGERFRFMQFKMDAERPAFIVLKYDSGVYSIQLNTLVDGITKVKTAWVVLPDAPVTIEVEWQASSAPGADDGFARLFLDDLQEAELAGLDNDEITITSFRMGFTSRLVDKSISGIFYIDDVATSTDGHIGVP